MAREKIELKSFASLMGPDLRSGKVYSRVQHFKTFPHKLVPQFSTEADESQGLDIVRFAIAPWLSTGYRLFGLGFFVGQNSPAIYMRNSSGDIINTTWATPASNEASGGARDT